MSTRNPAADRSHGGPGSSHENVDKPAPATSRRGSGGRDNNPPPPDQPTNDRSSHASGGGGERDKHHSHDPKTKR
ncbi:MAG: hypothetical protein JO157_07765 [Acetobacteraceae bacterium]|nr:hypothetical protein [Acetobacteraceae bacterium]